MLGKIFNPYVVALLLSSGLLTDARDSLLRADGGTITNVGTTVGYNPATEDLKPNIWGRGNFDGTPGATYTVDLIITPVNTSGNGTPVRAATINVTTGAAGGPFAGWGSWTADQLETWNPPLATMGWDVQVAITGTGADGSYYITAAIYFPISGD